ncbi:MAG TPA: hypothetical protein VD840_00290 [Sinorhizobium sp.]|nr:hypothetical protein [Sinorhizobium sp.]
MARNVVPSLARVALVAVAMAAYPIPADSQLVTKCADRTRVIEFLAQQYSEKAAAVGLINPQTVMEVYAADNGSWTLIVTDVSGRSCVILAGTSWEGMARVGNRV